MNPPKPSPSPGHTAAQDCFSTLQFADNGLGAGHLSQRFPSGKSSPSTCGFAAVWLLLIALCFAPALQAGTHEMLRVWGATSWSGTVTVSGGGVQLAAVKGDFQEDDLDWERPLAVYTVKNTAEVRINVIYSGSAPLLEGSVSVNGRPGYEYVHPISLERGFSQASGPQLIIVRATALLEDELGEIYYSNFETQFLMDTRFYRLLDVEMNNTSGSFDRTLTSYRVTPQIVTHPGTGFDKIHLNKSNWDDVGVQLVPKGAIGVTPPEWQRTDPSGYASVRLSAPTDGENFEEGFLSDEFTLRAVKDGCQYEEDIGNFIPYAIVRDARNVWFLGESGGLGDITEPVLPPMTLKPGNVVQVGSRLVTGELEVEFCNGQKAYLEASNYEGFRATVGAGDLIQGRPLIWLDLKGMAQDLKDNPRRCLRMTIYKGLGAAVDSVARVPDPVGWVTETPGAKVEKWLANWGERAYQPPLPPQPKPVQIRNQGPAVDSNLHTSANTVFDFYTDGTLWVENAGSPVALDSEAGQRRGLPMGGATFIQANAAGDQIPSAAATSTTAWEAPAVGVWTLTPTNGQIVTTRTPILSLANSQPGACVWETAVLRLDGRDITSRFPLRRWPGEIIAQISAQPGAFQPLSNGPHTFSYSMATLAGELTQGTVTFTVNAPASTPGFAQSFAFSGGVWLSWERAPGASGYRIWRAASTNDTPVALTTTPRLEPGFLDVAPLTNNAYWVEALDGTGAGSGFNCFTESKWSATLAEAPPVAMIGTNAFQLGETNRGIVLTFDASSSRNTRWQLARATVATGPFMTLAPQEDTVDGVYLDTAVQPGGTYFYQLTPRRVDGTPGTPLIAGPVSFSSAPSAPQGLSAHAVGVDALIAWNPYDDPRAQTLRLYRDSGTGFSLVRELPVNAESTTVAGAGNTISRYHLVGVGNGGESQPSVVAGTARQPRPAAAAAIHFLTEELRVREGDGEAVVQLRRTGNLGEPAVVFFVAEPGNWGQAIPDEDFAKVAGSLIFAPGQTNALVRIPILADALSEYPEQFQLHITTPLGATETTANFPIIIEESDVLLAGDYQSEITVNENDGIATLTIDRIWPSQRTVSVTLAPADAPGSAILGTDYSAPASWVVTFAPGQARQTLALPLINNAVKDGGKTLNLDLTQPQGGASVDEFFGALTLRIRDDETMPGQFRLDAALAQPLRAAPGQDSLTIPLTRTGGTDGSISAFIMLGSGTLTRDAVSFSRTSVQLGEGQTGQSFQITIDRSHLLPGIAPFGIVEIMNEEYPYEIHSVTVIFAPEDAAENFPTWAAGRGLSGANSGMLDDPDGDGAYNLLELAMGSESRLASSRPGFDYEAGFGQLSLRCAITPSPRLVVLGEFSDRLTWDAPQLMAGHWEWSEASQTYQVRFSHWQDRSPSLFGRLRFIWLD